jgi:GT2 family glycosyltransferase
LITPLRLGFLGSLMVSKGPHVLLEALGRLPPGSATVDLFGAYTPYHGDDRYRETLAPLMSRPGVRARGAVPHDRVPEALASIDVLVVPSIWPENSPLVIQEAFLAGVPVVASRIGGIPEAVADGVSGLLFAPGDSEALARCVSRLLNEPELLPALRRGIPPVRSLDEDVGLTRSFYLDRGSAPEPGSARGDPAVDLPEHPRLAAVVLNFRTPDDTLLAVRSLRASRRHIDTIIVVDNSPGGSGGLPGSDRVDDLRRVLEDVWTEITYLPTERNLGFSGGMNVGIREALAKGADRVMLVNSDVIVPPDCVERLEEGLEAPGAGIVGPIVLSRSAPDLVASLGMSYSPATGRMRHRGFGRRVEYSDRQSRTVVDGVSGCLMLVRRDVFVAAGLLDEEFFFGFEDLEFCLRARRAGFTTAIAGRAAAFHEGGRSIGAASVRRFYFAARNHLLVARRAVPASSRTRFAGQALSIVMLNVGHALVSPGASLPARLGAVARGTRDFLRGRFGADSETGV